MTDVAFDVPVTTPQKREYDSIDEIPAMASSAKTAASSMTPAAGREPSPALSTTSSLTELAPSVPSPGSHNTQRPTQNSAEPPVKKRKLTFMEKEVEKAVRQREKEEKQRAKEEEKARKEEEKRLRDVERQKAAEEKEAAKLAKEVEKAEKQKAKDAEKEAKQNEKDAKQKEKDAKKHEKENEKAKAEADKLKKERAQMRIGNFFGKPAPQATPPSTPDDVSEGVASRRSSVASIDMSRPVLETKTPSKSANNDFDRWILPFFVPEHTAVAPTNRYKLGRIFDFDLNVTDGSVQTAVDKHFGRPRKRTRKTVPVKQIIQQLQHINTDTIDLAKEDILELASIPCKHLQYQEDVRPPYQGTFTRVVTPRTARRVSRNPFRKEMPDMNYDVDSEAEWEPPAPDDEELNDEDEMSDAEGDEDEMADFLDDADDLGRRRGPLTDMEPVSSGLCWAGEQFNDNGHNIRQYSMDVLHDSVQFPIDPYATTHWTDEAKSKPSPIKPRPASTLLQPPRNPLATLTPNALPSPRPQATLDGKPLSTPRGRPPNPDKELKLIDAEFLPAFKTAVKGSDLTKAGLIEILKKQFPKCSKDAIKDTLGVVAARVGKKEAEKRWELVENM